jgi:uncharacterized protein (TIGR02117 family)
MYFRPPRRRTTSRWALRFKGAFAAAVLCLLGAPTVRLVSAAEPGAPPASRLYPIYVVAGGWHTELALPVTSVGAPLSALDARFPGARYLVFGWGARGYYMARHPDFADLLRAATPGPAVMLVIPLTISPAAFAGPANTFGMAISPAGAARLSQLLWSELLPDRERVPHELGLGPDPGSIFFAATGTYDVSHTCNTWTAGALRAAGVPVSADGVVFADQLLYQLRQLH